MDTLLEQVANIEFWADMFVRELLALIRGSNGHVPMTLGAERVETEKEIDTIPTSLMMGQGQVEGGHQELDLNASADPEISQNYPFKRSVQELTRIIHNMKPLEKERIFPHYNRGLPIKDNPTIQESIADFLKQRDASTLKRDSSALVGLGKHSALCKEFIDYQLQKQDRGVE